MISSWCRGRGTGVLPCGGWRRRWWSRSQVPTSPPTSTSSKWKSWSLPWWSHANCRPLQQKKCKQADRVRSLCYNHRAQVEISEYEHWTLGRFDCFFFTRKSWSSPSMGIFIVGMLLEWSRCTSLFFHLAKLTWLSSKVMSKRLPHTLENVCLSTDEECQM